MLNCTTTTRACIFGTLHKEATLELMELLEDAGMHAYVGKVNMDRNSPDILREESAEDASKITECKTDFNSEIYSKLQRRTDEGNFSITEKI